MTENEMVGWHHSPNGHESEQTPGDGEGQGSLSSSVHAVAICRPDMTGRLNGDDYIIYKQIAKRVDFKCSHPPKEMYLQVLHFQIQPPENSRKFQKVSLECTAHAPVFTY